MSHPLESLQRVYRRASRFRVHELMGMHELGSWTSGAGSGFGARGRFRFLAVSLVITFVLLGGGMLSLQSTDVAWFGVFLVFCALTLAYLVPFLRASLVVNLGSAGPRP